MPSDDTGAVWTRRAFGKVGLGAALGIGLGGCDLGADSGAGEGLDPTSGPDLPSVTELGVPPVQWEGYRDAVVIDALGSPGPFNVQDRIGRPLTREMIGNAAHSGISAINVTVSGGGDDPFGATVSHLAYWERELATHPDVLTRIRTVDDIDAANRDGRLGLILGFQDTTMLGTDLGRLGLFHDFGVSIIQLTYNVTNAVGHGCLVARDEGLTEFGRSVVARMDELGIVVDLSHCGIQTTADGIEASSRPVAITHSGCRAVYDHPRSKPDHVLRALADGGGVVGIYLMPFLNADGPAQADDLYRHIEHAVQVCGEDHVGIGSDLSTTPTVADQTYLDGLRAFAEERQRLGIGAPREHEVLFVPELNHATRMGLIADGLLARGHSQARVEKIVGGNWRRLFDEVWSA